VKLDGKSALADYSASTGVLSVSTAGVSAGQHQLAVEASDYQEAKNMENTGPVLPNTRFFRTTVTVR
jgi:hypothetical protein